MRILLWPTYSYPGNVGADSLYLIGRNLIRAVPEGRIQWVVIVPDSKSVPVDDLDTRTDVQKVRVKMPATYRQQESVALPDVVWKYAGVDGTEPVDAVLSMSPARSLNLANAWGQKSTRITKQVIATWDLLVRDDGNGEFSSFDQELIHQAAGSLASDVIYHESPVARRMTLDIVRKYLSSSSIRTVVEKSVDIPQGVDINAVVNIALTTPKRDRFTIYYGGRFSTSKRVNEIAEIADTFYRFGRDVDFVVTTGSLDGMKRAAFEKAVPQAELHVGLSQEEAFKLMAGCHVSFCFSNHELFGMAFWEQIAAGLGVVMLAKDWNKDLLPPGYDKLVHSPAEAGAMLRLLYSHWLEVPGQEWTSTHGMASKHAQWVRANYDSAVTLTNLVQDLENRVETVTIAGAMEFGRGKQAALVETVTAALEGRDEPLTLEDFYGAVRAGSRVGKNFIGNRMSWGKSNGALDGLRVARWLGWEDCFIDDVAALRKVGLK